VVVAALVIEGALEVVDAIANRFALAEDEIAGLAVDRHRRRKPHGVELDRAFGLPLAEPQVGSVGILGCPKHVPVPLPVAGQPVVVVVGEAGARDDAAAAAGAPGADLEMVELAGFELDALASPVVGVVAGAGHLQRLPVDPPASAARKRPARRRIDALVELCVGHLDRRNAGRHQKQHRASDRRDLRPRDPSARETKGAQKRRQPRNGALCAPYRLGGIHASTLSIMSIVSSI
jgi:hypothetical protein